MSSRPMAHHWAPWPVKTNPNLGAVVLDFEVLNLPESSVLIRPEMLSPEKVDTQGNRDRRLPSV